MEQAILRQPSLPGRAREAADSVNQIIFRLQEQSLTGDEVPGQPAQSRLPLRLCRVQAGDHLRQSHGQDWIRDEKQPERQCAQAATFLADGAKMHNRLCQLADPRCAGFTCQLRHECGTDVSPLGTAGIEFLQRPGQFRRDVGIREEPAVERRPGLRPLIVGRMQLGERFPDQRSFPVGHFGRELGEQCMPLSGLVVLTGRETDDGRG